MKTSHLGFNQDLFILPFDHRGSFQEKLLGIKGRLPSLEEIQEITAYKKIIFQGFKKAIDEGAPKEKAGILVDEQYGSEILQEAQQTGFMTACPAEKSGQDEFDFEYGEHFKEHIEQLNPTFVKVLVRYNPEGDPVMNQRQCEKLKELSDFCHQTRKKFMFELLVPPTPQQLNFCHQNSSNYDDSLRPSLMVRAIRALQDFGVEPDVWKLEGIQTLSDAQKVATQAQLHHRHQVGVIVLGRGENAEKVKQWLTTAAQIPGLIGFAVGRTVFWNPLMQLRAQQQTQEETIHQIAQHYKSFCELWTETRKKHNTHSMSPKGPHEMN